MPDWMAVKDGILSAATLRKECIHAHGLVLHVLGIIGQNLILANPSNWEKNLKKLNNIDWSKNNANLWEGRALVGGRVSKAHNNVILTSNVIKGFLNLPLSLHLKKLMRSIVFGIGSGDLDKFRLMVFLFRLHELMWLQGKCF